ncbi:MAG: S-layer homology domain-containing protein [Cyanobacteria bacterium J06639_1]
MDRQHELTHLPAKPRGTGAIVLTCTVALFLAGCQNTEWGQRLGRAIAPPIPAESPQSDPPAPTDPAEPTSEGQAPSTSESTSSESTSGSSVPEPASPTPAVRVSGLRFQDLDEAPAAREAIAALDELGVFDEVVGDRFAPTRSIRRGEFARWLVRANNAVYADRPARQIRLGTPSDTPIFLDVPEDRPDFIYIQALARAGLAQGDRDGTFQPDLLLSRAELIRMKGAIDAPPPALGEAEARATVSQLWGFSDADEIPTSVLNTLIADARLGDDSTVSRTFGLTRVFDSQTPITRGEAAIALSAFGSSGDLRKAIELVSSPPAPELSPTSPSDASEDDERAIDEPSPPIDTPISDPEPASAPEAELEDTKAEPEDTEAELEDTEPEGDRPPTQDAAPESSSTDPSPGRGGFITDTLDSNPAEN